MRKPGITGRDTEDIIIPCLPFDLPLMKANRVSGRPVDHAFFNQKRAASLTKEDAIVGRTTMSVWAAMHAEDQVSAQHGVRLPAQNETYARKQRGRPFGLHSLIPYA